VNKDTVATPAVRRLVVVLVVVTKYDAEGYLVQFHKGVLPCNTLAAMWSLTKAAFEKPELENVHCQVIAFDERIRRGPVKARQIMKTYGGPDTSVVVGLVGVQTNMFPRARQLALEFKAAGATVVMGGFHISGSITMLHDGNGEASIPCPRVMPPECVDLMEKGIILFHGEAEGTWHEVLGDIVRRKEKAVYRGGRPPLVAAPLPEYPPGYFNNFFDRMHTLDTGRGCPFTCSFCTIINVQGHDPRYRSVEAIVSRVRQACAQVSSPFFFFTDDNFARNPHWKSILEGLARLRAQGLKFTIMVEADLVAWKMPGFVDLLGAAGCTQVFLGVETVRQQTLNLTRKRQNKVADYAAMCARYHEFGIVCHAGYILGFPEDTPQSIAEDVDTLKDIGFDQVSFFILTPLPGSEDHVRQYVADVPMDGDLNNYDSFQPVIDHAVMSRKEWQDAYNLAWRQFYTPRQMASALGRISKSQYWGFFRNLLWYRWSALVEGVHPMMAGFIRHKHYASRRPSARQMSRTEHVLRQGRRFLRYVALGFREFLVLQQVYFASRCTGFTEDGEAPSEVRFKRWRAQVRRSRWFGRTFGRAAHREWLNAFWQRYARLEWRLLLPQGWIWHLKAFSCATTEVVYAIRFSTVVLLQLLRQRVKTGRPSSIAMTTDYSSF
jgi:radical SAM superfamily enzyme YgiQ (UPF0313 family)